MQGHTLHARSSASFGYHYFFLKFVKLQFLLFRIWSIFVPIVKLNQTQ